MSFDEYQDYLDELVADRFAREEALAACGESAADVEIRDEERPESWEESLAFDEVYDF